MVSVDDLQEVHGLFKEPIIGLLTFKMTETRALKIVKSHISTKITRFR